MPGHHTNQQMSQQDTLTPDLGKYIRDENRVDGTLLVIGALESKHVEHALLISYVMKILTRPSILDNFQEKRCGYRSND